MANLIQNLSILNEPLYVNKQTNKQTKDVPWKYVRSQRESSFHHLITCLEDFQNELCNWLSSHKLSVLAHF